MVSRARKDQNWIEKAIKHKGALHDELHVQDGANIPANKLKAAENSSDSTTRHRASLAKTLKKFSQRNK